MKEKLYQKKDSIKHFLLLF